MADEIKAEDVLTGKPDENYSDLPYHNRETQKIAEEREAEIAFISSAIHPPLSLGLDELAEYPKILPDGRVIVTESGKTQDELDAEIAAQQE